MTRPSTVVARVYLIHPYPHAVGGSQRVIAAIAAGLKAEGVQAEIVLPDTGPFYEWLVSRGIAVKVIRSSRLGRTYGGADSRWRRGVSAIGMISYSVRLVAFLRRSRPTLVHVNDHRGALTAGVPARLLRLPVVWHVHGVYPSRTATWIAAKCATRIIVPSAAAARLTPFPACAFRKLRVVPNWLDDESIPSLEWNATPERSYKIVCAANLRPEKGIDVLIKAFAIVRASLPNSTLEICGGPQHGYERYHKHLRELISGSGLRNAVTLAAYRDSVFVGWQDAGIYVQPSRSETFGLAALEAMATGIPVVMTSAGGLPELARDGLEALIVPPDDPAALAAGILRVMKDDELRQRLRVNARLRASTEFSGSAGIKRVLAVYAEAVSRATPTLRFDRN